MVALGAGVARSMRVFTWVAAVALLAAAVVVGPLAQASHASTLSVSNETEFRAALATLSVDVSGSHTINISNDFTITDAASDPYYSGTRNLTINGNGHTVGLSVGDVAEFLWFDSNATLYVDNLTVQNFRSPWPGGAIYSGAGDMVITDSTFSGNSSSGDTSSYGGAIYSDGDITVIDSTFANNFVDDSGGIDVDSFGGALGSFSGAITVSGSTFTGNYATGDSAAAGGAISASGPLVITNTTFDSNHVATTSGSTVGGAVYAVGLTVSIAGSLFRSNSAAAVGGDGGAGAVYLFDGGTVENTTFLGNSATSSSAGGLGGAMVVEGSTTLRHVTAVGNSAATGGATVQNFGGVLTVVDSILTGPIGATNCTHDTTYTSASGLSGGYNFVSDSSCFAALGTDISGSDPQLNGLQDNGGPTWTMEPASPSSPVVDVIPEAQCTVLFDQRGVTRPRGGACDIGAVELLLPDYGVVRLAGDNRYGTAARISAYHHPFGASTIFMSTGANFPDALAGAGVAAGLTAPLMLTGGTAIPPETSAELHRLNPSASFVLGGTGVVSTGVETALGAYGPVTRLAGDDRYATSVAISQDAYPSGAGTVLIAVGSGFADALAGGPLAKLVDGPVLLTATNALPASVRAEIVRLAPTTIVVLGGTGVVSDAVFADLGTLASTTVRLSGESRYETSVAISQYGWPVTTGVHSVYVATGANFPDALAGAAEAAANGVPILLTDSNTLPAAVADEVDRLGVDTIYILGGTGVVSPTVETQLAGHLAPI